jgi:tryptophanase
MHARIEPYKIKVVEPIPFTTRAERERALADAGWNLFRLAADLVTIDLLTDSGVTAMSAHQWSALFDGDEAYAGARSFQRFERAVHELTGMPHVIPAHQGRAAERLLFEEIVRPGDVVPGNTHFDTTRANLEARGAEAVDLPLPAARSAALEAPFKGDIDLGALAALLARTPRERVPLVLITITSNGCGGQPVSLANLTAARALCDRHGVPLYLDAARFAENAWLIREREPGLGQLTPAAIARSAFLLADGCLVSAKKDGLVNIGGFLALRDGGHADRIRRNMVLGEGFPTYGGLAGRDLEAMARGLEEVLDPAYLRERIAQVRSLGDALHGAGVPTVRPPGGHAVYLDSRAFAPHIDPLGRPGQAIACELYLHAGVRAVEIGQLMRGRPDAGGVEAPVDQDLVRLAIPRRVYTCCHLEYVAEAVCEVFARRAALGPLELVEQPPVLRHFGARLRPAPAAIELRRARLASAGGHRRSST